MSAKKRTRSPAYLWEQSLIEAYYDYRWHQVLDPLYDQFKHWDAGELEHHDMDQAIHQAHKLTQELFGIFTMKRDFLVHSIQFDAEWFNPWVKENPPPTGYELVNLPPAA